MSNLYHIGLEHLRIINMIEEAEGELTEEIELELGNLTEVRDEFINSLCQQHANLLANSVKIKDEVERLNGRKKDIMSKIDTTKKTISKLLKHFDMKSTSRDSTGFAFDTGLFKGHTRSAESIEIDDLLFSSTFIPLTGKKSKHVDYDIKGKVTHEQLTKLNELGILPVTSYSPVVNKKSTKLYLNAPQSHESKDGVETDPIADIANIVNNESLIIK